MALTGLKVYTYKYYYPTLGPTWAIGPGAQGTHPQINRHGPYWPFGPGPMGPYGA